ncbi:MAG: hypothetical protein U0350_02205 [Caldilineaceae bacterium]
MKPELYTRVVLTRNLPEEKLRKGDLAWVIEYLEHPEGGEEGAILEIFNALGESLRIVTVPVSAIASLRPNQVPTVRELVMAS